MQGNENAKKPDANKITGKGRIVIDLGDLKGEAVRASRARKMKLAPWIREAIEEKVARELGDAPSVDPKIEAEIERLQEEARITPHGKERNAIFRKLEELTGGGRETRTIEGNTRFIRTRTNLSD